MTKNIIAYDFNGVMDVEKSHLIKESGLSFRVRKQFDIDKARALLMLAFETNTPLISISLLDANVNINQQLIACLMHHGTEEDKVFFKENKRNFRKLFKRSFESAGNKQKTIDECVKDGYKVFALEDEVPLTNCELLWVNGGNISTHLETILKTISNQ